MDTMERDSVELWKVLAPDEAYLSGMEDCAGHVFSYSREYVENIRSRMDAIWKGSVDIHTRSLVRWARCRLDLHEPPSAPCEILGSLTALLVKGGSRSPRLPEALERAISCLETSRQELNLSLWPLESRIVALKNCGTLQEVVRSIPDREGTPDPISGLMEDLSTYMEMLHPGPISGASTSEMMEILEQGSGHLGRRDIFSRITADVYGMPERASDIEERSLVGLYREIPALGGICAHLGDQYSVRPFVSDVMEVIRREREVPSRYVIDLSFKLRRALMDWAEKMIVRYPRESRMRSIEAPLYMMPIIGNGLSYNMDGHIGRPRTDLFLPTGSGTGSPPCLPGIFQVLTREELGHRPLYLNSFASRKHGGPGMDLMMRPSSRAQSMGYAIEREAEVLGHLKDMENRKDELLRDEQVLVNLIEELYPLEEFISDLEFLVTRERVLCTLRSLADIRLNTGQQSIPGFIRWAHIVTGIDQGELLGEVLDVAASPGFHSTVYFVASDLSDIGQSRMDDGISTMEFNTASTGFGYPPWRSLRDELSGI